MVSGANAYVTTTDEYAWCTTSAAALAGAEKFHPLMQVASTAGTYLHTNAAATAAKTSFTGASSTDADPLITAAQ